ncbi:MAG TPA: NUDIX domain-containing protein [Candidatus Saccharimonadales bacterium]|nr:NUDIX domain-containing protein [Candidatus Saccharimonadales bacterium]
MTMLEHHIQREILHNVVLGKTHFAEMQPAGVASNLYNYHLHQLLVQKLLIKNGDGSYELTERGKQEGIHLGVKPAVASAEAHSVILLAVRRDDGAWLLRKRLAQPNIGLIGFVHGEPVADEPVTETAKRRLQGKTGLTADFHAVCSGLVTIYRHDELESYSHCILLSAKNPYGTLIAQDKTGENSWQSEPGFTSPEMLPSMPEIAKIVTGEAAPEFFELTYRL